MKDNQEKTKHTPGPWEKGENGFGDIMMVYCDDELGSAVADCSVKHYMKLTIDERLANAKLIAAAPSLLQSLIELVDVMPSITPDHQEARVKAIESINKATL